MNSTTAALASKKRRTLQQSLRTPTLQNPNNYFRQITQGRTKPDAAISYRSSPPNNDLSQRTLELDSGKALQDAVPNACEKVYHTELCATTSLSSNPKDNVSVWHVGSFPPNDECQNLGVNGILSTMVLTGVENEVDKYESLACIPQCPSIGSYNTTQMRIIGRYCRITEELAEIALNESSMYFDILPVTGPFNQANDNQKSTTLGTNYGKMRKIFDPLSMEHMLEVVRSDLVPNLECLHIHGEDPWIFMTELFPEAYPEEYYKYIYPLIIQNGPIIHGTVIDNFHPTPRQGYTCVEATINMINFLNGDEDYNRKLIDFSRAATIFSFGKTKNDGSEGDDHFIYFVTFEQYDGDDKTVFVARDRKHLQQLMEDEKDGRGRPARFPSQEVLRTGPQTLETMYLTVAVVHFFSYYQQRNKQMNRSDFGVMNRKGAHKAWKEYFDAKQKKDDDEKKKGFGNMLGGILDKASWGE